MALVSTKYLLSMGGGTVPADPATAGTMFAL